MRHHAIVVSSWSEEDIKRAHSKAQEIFPWVSPISPPMTNGYASFFIPPDGSKEGWERSDFGDGERNQFIDWLDTQRYGDGSSPLGWVEVQFYDDYNESIVTRHSDEETRQNAGELDLPMFAQRGAET